MPTQKLPRPHVFTPPDLTLIFDDIFGTHKTSLVGRYGVDIGTRSRIGFPPEVRGLTHVTYVHPVHYADQDRKYFYGEGRAYLRTPDVFSEPFGVALATVRAVTDLIERHQPVNAADIGVRIGRYLDDVVDTSNFTVSDGVILDRAADKLAEAIQKCQASK